jgi:alkylhydroperoxidase/carboxymuconolactone decarboxylase family protein YurZ
MTTPDREGARTEHDRLVAKDGPEMFEQLPLLTASRFERKLAQRDAVDQHFAKISMDFATGVLRRPGLDRELRYLVLIGQFAVAKAHTHLEDTVRAALLEGVPIRKALEAILFTHIYAGDTALEPAMTTFTRVALELGMLDALRDDQLPIDGPARDHETEAGAWPAAFTDDPRADDLMETFGWRGVSTGFRYRGSHHLDSLETHARHDVEFGRLWETFTYQGMYSRWILDDKTRLLCTTADCLALGAGAAESARDHMEEALQFGNSPREVFEVVLMSGLFFGFPGMSAARSALFSILKEQGRIDEL